VFTRKPAAPHIVSPNIEPFRGGKHPLSNYFPVDISVEDVSYPTAEHYYQHAKAMSLGLPDEADEVLYADTLYKAMTLGNDLDNLVSAAEITLWHDQRVEVMRRTLDLKYHASPEFREHLFCTKDKTLVEATSNPFWASGLPPSKTLRISASLWPGRNQLGLLLMELRSISQENLSPQINVAELADELIGHALKSDDTNLTSPDVLARADALLNTPQCRQQLPVTSQAPTPLVRNKRKAALLSPLENAAKRDTTPKIDTIFQKNSQHVLSHHKPH
jgi:ribA/ribD-fused uncharacterized protein